jgi:steroid delta-isomerase-like uncharacterized protein
MAEPSSMAEDERHPALTPVSGFLRAWSGRDASAFAAVCDPGLHYEDPLTVAPLRGPAELGDHAARLWEAFPDVTVEAVGEPTAGARAVAVPCRVEGTHGAALAGLPATGRRVAVHGVFWVEPAGDGRLLRVRAFFDLYDAGVQLGILPSRGGLGERALLVLRGFGLRVKERP